MKWFYDILSFTLLLFFFSCKEIPQQESKENASIKTIIKSEAGIQQKDISEIDAPLNNIAETNSSQIDLDKYRKEQDSIRRVLFKTKVNSVLKNSLLEELYIRNLAKVTAGRVLVNIPFDLHGRDCIAMDCYTTNVSFSMKLTDKLVFPKQLEITEHEYGCDVIETKFTDHFLLKELTASHVIYQSARYKRKLVIFRSNKESTDFAFYFSKIDLEKLDKIDLYNVYENYNKEVDDIVPFTSHTLNKPYEEFLQ